LLADVQQASGICTGIYTGYVMEKGRVLLIVHDLHQDDVYFPLSTGYLAAALRESGAEVTICDQSVFHYSNEELAEKFLINEEYDLIGIGFLAARFTETVLGLCETVNKYKKKAKLILGGHGPSAVPLYMLDKTQADLVAIGEAEETIVEVLHVILQDRSFENVLGIAYREENIFHVNNRRPIVKKLDDISWPAWELFPIDQYATATLVPGQTPGTKSMQIISSRGCINRCTFCHRLEKGIRFRDIRTVVYEMKLLYERYDITFFRFLDELFLCSYKRLVDFVAELKKEKLLGKIQYNAGGIRANILTEQMAELLYSSGCRSTVVGIESLSQQCLDEYKKNTVVADNIRCLELLRKYNIYVGIGILWGAPSDTEETMRQTVDFLKKYSSDGDLRTIRPVTPYPGSEMYEQAIVKGLLTGPQDFFDRFKNSDLVTVNFTKIPTEKVYDLLFEANTELILDHYKHVPNSEEKTNQMIDNFYDLYFKGYVTFRGARRHIKGD